MFTNVDLPTPEGPSSAPVVPGPTSARTRSTPSRVRAETKGLRSFLERIYYQLRNLGTGAQDRAMNFAATNAFQTKEVFEGVALTFAIVVAPVPLPKLPVLGLLRSQRRL